MEANLSCGDTITVQSAPAIGAYRFCIHCDSKKKVTEVRDYDMDDCRSENWNEVEAREGSAMSTHISSSTEGYFVMSDIYTGKWDIDCISGPHH